MDAVETPKSLRLIEYLKDLVGLRSKVVYDIRNYDSVLWFHDVPKEKGCFTQAWGASEDVPEIWLEVKKRPEPPIPEVPEVCEDWVNKGSLYDSEELPELYSTIQQNSEVEVDGESCITTESLDISDFPQVMSAWEHYLEKAWLPWMEKHQVWKEIQKVYKQLFEIHQQQQKLGEEYELVLGLGLLQWLVPNEQSVRRHLVISKANLNFDHQSGTFTVTADEEGAKLDIELNMLDAYQPLSAVGSIKASFEIAEDNPWDRNMTESVLSSLANLIGEGNGEYCAELTYDSSITSKPKVYFAPALILRKRSLRGLEMVLDQIKELVKQNKSMPEWFSDLCEEPRISTGNTGSGMSKDVAGDAPAHVFEDGTVYFPLQSNSQQRQIVEKWQSADGILVQGPPGTGKSLTIANLICHLLANGQRVLVTAKTPRALQVLHALLPSEVAALCVSLLGKGIEERESLQKSVGLIHSRQAEWDPSVSQAHIADLEKNLNNEKAEKAKIESQIRKMRERDAGHHIILENTYSGTAAKIGATLNEQKAEFGWFTDEVMVDRDVNITDNDLHHFRSELLFFTEQIKNELSYDLVEPSQIPSSGEIRQLITKEASLQEELEEIEPLLDDRLEYIFQSTRKEVIETLLENIDLLYADTKTVLNRPYQWIEQAVHEILSDMDTPWKELESVTEHKLSGLKDRARQIDEQSLQVTTDLQESQLLADCRRLSEYIEKGGSCRLWAFKPRNIKRLRYISEHVLLNGEKCASLQILDKVVEHLEVKADIKYLWNLWKRQIDEVDEPLFIQVAHLEEALESLSAAVTLYEEMDNARQAISEIDGLQEPAWHSIDEVYRLCCACRVVLNRAELKETRTRIDDMFFGVESIAKKPRMHSCISDLAAAIHDRDYIRYSEVAARIAEIETLAKRWKSLQRTVETMQTHFPKLVETLQNTAEDPIWQVRLNNFDSAYKWARAKKWLEEYLTEDNLPLLHTKLKRCESRSSSLLSELAAEKAWSFCLTRMTDEQGRNLRLFSRVRIPKSGKTILRKRREAQAYLNNCKGAVPAWIMPLHRVYDTVTPSAEKFDVIIVDEASQCGQEALPLFFLGKKIIIVGDDKQISPMTVGVKDELIQQLTQRYLHDFKYKETFEPKKSLFEQAFYRFPPRHHIRLREHFRCMPEIIRFSNDLCYTDQPLIPLRQFSSQRLDPLKSVYIQNGYREGNLSHVYNRPEAEALVETIVNCCADDAYQDKTMGVIVLQGHMQDRLIAEMLAKELDAEESENRRLLCGDPYSFQGDERDVIFLSMVAAPNERSASLGSEDFVRRFNVAASRAKDQMWLFHSVELPDLGPNCLRRRLLSFFMGRQSFKVVPQHCICENIDELRHQAANVNRSLVRSPEPFDSWFEVDVFLGLANRNYRVLPQYPFAGKRIDLVVEGIGGEQLAVECYGDYWHGDEQYEKDAFRQRQLERCGWKFHIIRECEYRADAAKCIEMLLAELNQRGIQPWTTIEVHAEILQEEKVTGVQEVKAELIAKALPSQSSPEPKEACLSNVQEVLELKSKALQSIIVQVLSKRPNKTCIREKLHTYILKELGITTRGVPRQKFARKVDQSVRHLAKKRQVEVYKSKNNRVRLLVDYSSLF